jgi:hypothetical protein|tara:strand:- start:49657 stop:49812 length:156 start_codon:yes stop_codon:yes gene_type:complete
MVKKLISLRGLGMTFSEAGAMDLSYTKEISEGNVVEIMESASVSKFLPVAK